jgi:hypothetical protein
MWDEIKVFKTNNKLAEGINAPKIQLEKFSKKNIMEDTLITYYNN